MMIPLTQGKSALIDDQDYSLISGYKWYANKYSKTFYAATNIKYPSGKTGTLLMHILIMGSRPGYVVDHIDRNGLNNKRSNLRFATRSQNHMNVPPQVRGSSIYKGVHWKKDRNKWRAEIRVAGRTVFLGDFNDEIAAARAYDKAAKRHFGEFAYLNFKE